MADELFKIQGTIDVDNKSANDAIDQTTQKLKALLLQWAVLFLQ